MLTQVFPHSGEWFLTGEARALEKEFGENLIWFPRAAGRRSLLNGMSLVEDYTLRPLQKLFLGLLHFPLQPFLFEVKVLLRARRLRGIVPLVVGALDVGSRLGFLLKSPRCDVYYSYWSSIDGLVAKLAADRNSALCLIRSHNSDFYPDEFGVPRPFVNYLHSPDGAATVHVYLSAKAKSFAEQVFGPVPAIVSPLGIELSAKSKPLGGPRERKPLKFTMVSASSPSPVKRLDLIATVFRELESRGVVSGWTHFGTEDADFFERVGMDLIENPNVICRGLIPNKELRCGLAKFEKGFFINLSSAEGLPVTLLEAGISGLPIAATNVGAVSDLIDEDTGLLLGAELSPRDLAQSICRWLNGKNLGDQVDKLRARIRANHDSAKTNERMVDLVREMLARDLS